MKKSCYCAREHVPIDFISTHVYGVKEGFFDETGERGTVLNGDRATVRSRMIHSRELIRQSPLPNLQLHFTELGSSYTPTDYMHDQYHQASFILDKIKGAQAYVGSMSYWGLHGYFRRRWSSDDALSRGLRTVELPGNSRAGYFAFQFLNRLGPMELVNAADSSWVCRNRAGDVQALFWNFTPVVPQRA